VAFRAESLPNSRDVIGEMSFATPRRPGNDLEMAQSRRALT
jgi:hypothetical protein